MTEIHFLDTQESGTSMTNKMKGEIKLPSGMKRRVSLSDIIAATIGEEARSSDLLYSDHEVTFYTESAQNEVSNDAFSDAMNGNLKQFDHHQSWDVLTENSNNACDFPDNGCQAMKYNDAVQKTFKDVSFSVTKTTDFDEKTDLNDFTPTTGFDTKKLDRNDFTPTIAFNTEKTDVNDFTPNIGFDTELDCLLSLFGSDGSETVKHTSVQQSPGTSLKTEMIGTNKEYSQKTVNTSYDSDLEDSMHFVNPDEGSLLEEPDNNLEPVEPCTKKQRVSLYDSSSCPFPITSENCSDGNQDFLCLFNDNIQCLETSSRSMFRMHEIKRARSFSGNITPKLSRQRGKCNLLNKNSEKMPSFGRTRSFSEACNRDELSPLGEGQFNTSLGSLLESEEGSPLANYPFFNDLKSLLIRDCQSMDCPKTLFETLSTKPKQDVYARERNLQSKFSSLQTKYSDEVRELSSFYRQQSAEVETERLKEIHEENMPISYRNHLNSFYDNQLHMIMERVEKSLSLLALAKREIITINRPFKSRPLLSRKAVKMMEEWYSRNFEHPYPGPTAVEALAKAGEITTEQVKKWFANKRNRCKNTKPVPEIANIKRKRQFSARW